MTSGHYTEFRGIPNNPDNKKKIKTDISVMTINNTYKRIPFLLQIQFINKKNRTKQNERMLQKSICAFNLKTREH